MAQPFLPLTVPTVSVRYLTYSPDKQPTHRWMVEHAPTKGKEYMNNFLLIDTTKWLPGVETEAFSTTCAVSIRRGL